MAPVRNSNIRGQTRPSQARPTGERSNDHIWERPLPAPNPAFNAERARRIGPRPLSTLPANKPPDAKSSAECWAHFAPRLRGLPRASGSGEWGEVPGCKARSSPHRCFTSSPGSFCILGEFIMHAERHAIADWMRPTFLRAFRARLVKAVPRFHRRPLSSFCRRAGSQQLRSLAFVLADRYDAALGIEPTARTGG
jgi:hypothetical protein